MEKDYQKLFQTLKNPEVPVGLQDAVLARIDTEARRASRIRFAIFAPLLIVSVISVISSFQYLVQETVQSGLTNYFSIILSDGGAVLTYWKEFLTYTADQAPILGLAIFFGTIFALLVSLKATLRNAQVIFPNAQLSN